MPNERKGDLKAEIGHVLLIDIVGYTKVIRPMLGTIRRSVCRLTRRAARWWAKRCGIEEVRGHHLFVNAISSATPVLDLGANRGEFSQAVSKKYGCPCAAIEASPALFAELSESELIKKFNFVVGGSKRKTQFFESSNSEANSMFPQIAAESGVTRSYPVTTIGYRELLTVANLPQPKILKVDIEGAEIEFLESLDGEDLAGLAQVTVEFHNVIAGVGQRTEIEKLKARFRRAGFLHFELGVYEIDHLFVHPGRCGLGVWRRLCTTVLAFGVLPMANGLERFSNPSRWLPGFVPN